MSIPESVTIAPAPKGEMKRHVLVNAASLVHPRPRGTYASPLLRFAVFEIMWWVLGLEMPLDNARVV